MERIKNKYDYLDNKSRPGSIWVSGFNRVGRNDHLRAVDPDGSEMRFTPESRYYASCEIKRGQAVSIAQLGDLTPEQANNKYPYVKITDPDYDDSCLGIALNYAREGQIVHIQSKGKFNYYTTKSPYYGMVIDTETDEEGKTKEVKSEDREIFLRSDTWGFKSVRGQKLYIKKVYNNATNANQNDWSEFSSDGDAFDTDHPDYQKQADTSNWFTFDFADSVYNVKNTIQVGYLTDAPTEDATNILGYERKENGDGVFYYPYKIKRNSDGKLEEYLDTENPVKNGKHVVRENGKWVNKDTGKFIDHADYSWMVEGENGRFFAYDDFLVTIELDVTGDTRGPVDNTQFLLTLGESIYFNTRKVDVDLEETIQKGDVVEYVHEPDFNAGVYDEVKVVAIAEGHPRAPVFKVFTVKELNAMDLPEYEYSFVSVRKLDGDTYMIPILKGFTLDDLDGGIVSVDDEGYFKLSKAFAAINALDGTKNEIKIAEPLTLVNRDTLSEAISEALKFVFRNDETGVKGCTPVVENIGDDGFKITTKEVGGYYDIYVSRNMTPFISPTNVEHGQSADEGQAILADIRDHSRLNIAGVVLSNTTGVHKKGELIKVMKMGRMVTMGNLWPGKKYYLGLNGRLTARKQYWYDHCVEVGTADSSNYFIVDCSQPLHGYSGNFPLGYMKPSVNGMNEKGFLLMDGVTIYSKSAYPELYRALRNWFSEEELKPSALYDEKYVQQSALKYMEGFKQIIDEFDGLLDNVQEQKELVNKLLEKYNMVDQRITEAEESEEIESLRKLLMDNVEVLTASINSKSSELKDYIDSNISSLRESVAVEFNRIKDLIDESAESLRNKEIKGLSDKLDEISSALNKLREDVESENENLQSQIDSLNEDVSKNKSSIEELKEKDSEINSQLVALYEKMETADEKLKESIQGAIEDLKAQKESVEKSLSDLNAQNITLTEELNELTAELEKEKSDRQTVSDKLDDVEELVNNMKEKVDVLSIVSGFFVNGVNKIGIGELEETRRLGDVVNLTREFFESLGVDLPTHYDIIDESTGKAIGLGNPYTLGVTNKIKIVDMDDSSN